jgi:hypothetical protein
MVKNVMLNLFQHLIEFDTYETLNQVQGDKKGFATQPPQGEGYNLSSHQKREIRLCVECRYFPFSEKQN